jgi:hypothetical protein
MFRAKVIISYAVLIVGLTAAVFFLQRSTVTPEVRRDTLESIDRSLVVAHRSLRLKEMALVAKAEFVGRRPSLHLELGKSTGGERDEGQRHLDVHQALDASKIAVSDMLAGESEMRDPNHQLISSLPLENGIYMVLDDDGIGQAALGKDLYSWFGEDVGKRYPIVDRVLQSNKTHTAIWKWSFRVKEKPQHYLVAVAPVRPSLDSEPTGVVVIGTSLDDGLANEMQMDVGGDPDIDKPDKEQRAAAPQIVFFRGEKILGSTFSTTVQESLTVQLSAGEGLLGDEGRSEALDIELGDQQYLARARSMPAGESIDEKMGVVVMGSMSRGLAPFESMYIDTILIAGAVLLLGILALLFILQRFLSAFDRIDQGIQEIIAGNKDYEFEIPPSNDYAAGLAHSLNIMSAFLQGKPMPDSDDLGDSGWSDLMGGGGGGGGGKNDGDKPEVQGVSMSDLMGGGSSSGGGGDDGSSSQG